MIFHKALECFVLLYINIQKLAAFIIAIIKTKSHFNHDYFIFILKFTISNNII